MQRGLQRLPWLVVAGLLVIAACEQGAPAPPLTAAAPGWSSNVVGVSEMHLSVNYWIDRVDAPDEVLADTAEIAAFVRNSFDIDPNLVDLVAYPDTLPGSEVAATIRSISKPYSTDLYYHDGRAVSAEDYERYTANLGLDGLADTVAVRYGMVVARANMRTWPTDETVFKTVETIDLDRFQENGLFPSDVVAVLHASADGAWLFVQSYNYAAWVHADKIAIGARREILDYQRAEPFLVIAGSRARTNYSPTSTTVSELQLDMGIRLPLIDPDDVEYNVDGQNPLGSYIVKLPARDAAGALEFRTALIARNQDVHIGYMPYTRRNVLHQAFKFLGERYGWGHSYNARDCTGLVQEVYRTFGFVLPRNSGQQGSSPIGSNLRIAPDASPDDKMDALAGADVGDLVYSTGHVMMFLGMVDGEPYVIHDLSGAGWTDEQGRFREGTLNGVSVTPLRRIHASPEATYFEQVYGIKRLR